jgi:uncharacterized cysteine cluster protein YcgN (CxxCxxCC family)
MKLNLLHQPDISSDSQPDTKSKMTVPMSTDSKSTAPLRPQFWTRFTLSELNHNEWEALCDGCGSCCLIKYIDEDENGDVDENLVEYTDVACQLMNCDTGYCQHYDTRQQYVPDCIQLTAEKLPNMMWLPEHCGYKRIHKGQALPDWHLLLTEDAVATQQQMRAANIGIAGRCVTETGMEDEEMETRVVNWVSP